MSPLDVPAALVLSAAAALGLILWIREAIKNARAHRNDPGGARVPQGTPSRESCHVTGCPIPGLCRVERLDWRTGVHEHIYVCHGHADEGEVYGWWLRSQGWRVAS